MAIFATNDDEITVKVARTLKEVGFEHVMDMEGNEIFRKLK